MKDVVVLTFGMRLVVSLCRPAGLKHISSADPTGTQQREYNHYLKKTTRRKLHVSRNHSQRSATGVQSISTTNTDAQMLFGTKNLLVWNKGTVTLQVRRQETLVIVNVHTRRSLTMSTCTAKVR